MKGPGTGLFKQLGASARSEMNKDADGIEYYFHGLHFPDNKLSSPGCGRRRRRQAQALSDPALSTANNTVVCNARYQYYTLFPAMPKKVLDDDGKVVLVLNDDAPAGYCTPHTIECTAGQRIKSGTGELSDPAGSTMARQCVQCPTGQFSHQINSRECKPHKQCALDEYIDSAGSASSDTKCAQCGRCNIGYFRQLYCMNEKDNTLTPPTTTTENSKARSSCAMPGHKLLSTAETCLAGGRLAGGDGTDSKGGCKKCSACSDSAADAEAPGEPQACTPFKDRICSQPSGDNGNIYPKDAAAAGDSTRVYDTLMRRMVIRMCAKDKSRTQAETDCAASVAQAATETESIRQAQANALAARMVQTQTDVANFFASANAPSDAPGDQVQDLVDGKMEYIKAQLVEESSAVVKTLTSAVHAKLGLLAADHKLGDVYQKEAIARQQEGQQQAEHDVAQHQELEANAAAFAAASVSLLASLDNKYPGLGKFMRRDSDKYHSQINAIVGKDFPESSALVNVGFQLIRRMQDAATETAANVQDTVELGSDLLSQGRQLLDSKSLKEALSNGKGTAKAGYAFAQQLRHTIQSGSKTFQRIKSTVKQLTRAVDAFVANPERALKRMGKTVLWQIGKAAILKAGTALQSMITGNPEPGYQPLKFLLPMASNCGSPFDALSLFNMGGFQLEIKFDIGPIRYDSSSREQMLESGGSIDIQTKVMKTFTMKGAASLVSEPTWP